MKKFINVSIVILLIAAISTSIILAVQCKRLNDKLENLNDVIEVLQEAQDTPIEYFNTHIVNSWWTHTNNCYTGTVYFDDLSNIKDITVTFADWALYPIEVENSFCSIDCTNNFIQIDYSAEDVQFAKITITYIDDTVETLYDHIAMG